MDYIPVQPKNKKGTELSLNWSGHSWLASLLEQLGCDMTGWSGSNDGRLIRAATCRAWAKAIKEALATDRIVEAVYTDSRCLGGENGAPVVRESANIPLRELLPAHEVSEQTAVRFAFVKATFSWSPDSNFKGIRPLAAEAKQWLQEIADFFKNCNGCRQF